MESSSAESFQSEVVASTPQEQQIAGSLDASGSGSVVKNASQPYTALKDSLKEGVGSSPSRIRFFGPRFLVIWVMPIAVTGILMEFLFVSPLRNINPFN